MKSKIGVYRTLQSVLQYVNEWRIIAAIIAMSILRNARDLGCVITIAYATDQVLQGGDVRIAVILMVIIMFSGAPLVALDNYLCAKYYLESQKKIQYGMSRRITELSYKWIETHKMGDVLSTYTADMELVCDWMSHTFPHMIRFVTYIVGALAYSISQSFLLTATVFPVIILIMPIMMELAKPLQKIFNMQREAVADSVANMQEVLFEPEFLKAYCMEKTMGERIDKAIKAKKSAEQESALFLGLIQVLGVLGSYLPGFVAAAGGVFFLWKNMITVGFLIGFVQMVVQRFGQMLPQVGEFATSSNKASASVGRIMELLNQPQERQDGEKSIPNVKIIVSLENVTFSYQETYHPALSHVSLKARQGETIALVGKSGSGKSTVIKLLMGLYETQMGNVNLLERNVKKWNLQAMRELIAPVFQDTVLFPISIRDNIADASVSDTKIWEVLQCTGLKKYVESLPKGLDTFIGERGVTLSGGQRQLLTIARAIIKDAPIILLDEPTSALDTVTENKLQMALKILTKDKTTIVVTHRLHTICDADRIYVFDHGNIVQEGTHESLITQSGIYSQLYQSQLKGSEK